MLARSLRQCLEQMASLGADYLLSDLVTEWTAASLLASLAHDHPERLEMPVYVRLPNAQQDGAISQVTPSGGFIRRYVIRIASD